MFKTIIAHSIDIDTHDAIEAVLYDCIKQLGDDQPDAGLLFVGIDHDHKLILNKINEQYPDIELIGCTTAAEISSIGGYTDDSINLILFSSDVLDFKAGVADQVSKNPTGIIKKSLDETQARLNEEAKLMLMTPSSMTISSDVVIESMKQVMGDSFPIFGGAAADPWTFVGTKQFYQNSVLLDSVPFLLISGPLLYSFGVESGWKPIGDKATVTKSDHNIVTEINDKPAIEFYRSYLGDGDLSELGEYPVAVHSENDDKFYLRACLLADTQSGHMSFAGDLNEGAIIQHTTMTRDRVVSAAKLSVDNAIKAFPGSKPEAALCFSCAGRREVLGTRTNEEYKLLNDHFPNLPFAGFYTYGEISPNHYGKPTRIHNETFVTLLFGTK